MHRAIIFNGVWVVIITASVFFLRGKQARRELDEQMNEEQKTSGVGMNEMATPFS
jgi:FLVCR family MFS transporter 7